MKKQALVAVLLLALASAGTAGALAERLFKLKRGDEAVLVGTKVGCSVVDVEGERALACYVYDAKGALPRSYGVAIADSGVAVLRYDAARKHKVVLEREHGK